MADHHDRCATLIDIVSRCTCERERDYDVATSTTSAGVPVFQRGDTSYEGALQYCYNEGVVAAFSHAGGRKPKCEHTYGPYREAWLDGLNTSWATAVRDLEG